jgi:hypothetical protein
MVVMLSDTLVVLEETNQLVKEGAIPMYSSLESTISKRFNQFYFSAVDTCTGK